MQNANRSVTWLAVSILCAMATGCQLIPRQSFQPTLHNPFPQLTSVAIIPFWNKSDDPTVDGKAFALAYYNELQQIPGFEVVSVGTVEEIIKQQDLSIQGADDVIRLGNLLGVDAVVFGTVNDYEAFYPPRCAIEVEWYAMNPCYHPIPAGYGLPWGTDEEQNIPDEIVLQAEMSLARAQMETQTPIPPQATQGNQQMPTGQMPSAVPSQQIQPYQNTPSQGYRPGQGVTVAGYQGAMNPPAASVATAPATAPPTESTSPAQVAPESVASESVPAEAVAVPGGMIAAGATPMSYHGYPSLPPNWPDPRGLIPDSPQPTRPSCVYSGEPVLRHTAIYNAEDSSFVAALQEYYKFQNDGRVGGWQLYLRRSDDFIRFCCRKHIWEMLSARGGAGQSRSVWEYPNFGH